MTPYNPNVEVNDVLHESPLRRVEFDKGCFGAKYQVFARNVPYGPWRHVAEAVTEEEALDISKDEDRCFGEELLTEVERRRASALRELIEQNEADGAYTKPSASPDSAERVAAAGVRLPESGAAPTKKAKSRG